MVWSGLDQAENVSHGMPTLAEAGAGRTPENKVSPVTPRCSAVGGANGGWHGAYGWSNKSALARKMPSRLF